MSTGMEVHVLLVDCDVAVLESLRLPEAFEDIAYGFDPDSQFALPEPGPLLGAAKDWIQSADPQENLVYYSADGAANELPDMEAESATPKTPMRAKAKMATTPGSRKERPRAGAPPGQDGIGGGLPKKPDKPKKVTTASLAASLQELMETMPFDFSGSGTCISSENHGEADDGSSCSFLPCLDATSFSGGRGKSFGAFGFEQDAAITAEDCSSSEPWFVAMPCLDSAGRCIGLGTGRAFITSCSRRRPLGPGCFGTEPSADEPGQSDSTGSVRPDGGFRRNLLFWHKGFDGQSSPSSRLGQPARFVLCLSDELHLTNNAADNAGRRELPADDGSRHLCHPVHRTLWRLRPSSRFGPDPIHGDANAGLSPSRKLASCSRLGSSSCSHDRAGRHGQRKVRSGFSAVPPRRHPIGGFHQSKCRSFLTVPKFLASGRSKVDNGGVSLLEGVGYNPEQTLRTVGASSKATWGESRTASSKAKGKPEKEGKRKGAASPADSCRGRGRELKEDETSDTLRGLHPLKAEVDFDTWCICLPRWIISSKTPFSWFLKRSFRVKRCIDKSASSTAFPLPIPKIGLFDCSGPGLSKKSLSKLARQRLLHVTVMALNFLYLGRFPTDAEIGRQPSPLHLKIFKRLAAHIAVCGATQEKFPIAPGRSGPQLASCLLQFENFADHCPEFHDPYHRVPGQLKFAEDPSLLPPEDFPELVPYRQLDSSRLRLVGKGRWKLDEFLHGSLWLPFLEPRFLLHNQPIDMSSVPSFRFESRAENLKLARLWDVNGLLTLFDSPVMPDHFSRVFQVYKSADRDRQIGDRRLPNAREAHACGPSKHLPPGQLLTQLHLPKNHILRGSVTDRRDFYHQASVSLSRAQSNLLPFKFSLDEFEGTTAFKDYQERLSLEKAKKKDRFSDGDGFGNRASPDHSSPGVYAGFASLFQGDHLGVEFALCGHEGLLTEENVFGDSGRLLGHHRVPFGPTWTGLIIDDFFCVGSEHKHVPTADSFAFTALAKARAAYEKHALEGSPEKDIIAERRLKAAGAEIDSSLSALRHGLCLVSSPVAKRIALSTLSLRAARLPMISPKLAARLSGNWVSTTLFRRCVSSVVDNFFSLSVGLEKPDAPSLVPLTRKTADELVILSGLVPLIASNIRAEYITELYASDASTQKGAFVKTSIPTDVANALWTSSDKKGSYTMLERPVKAYLRETLGEMQVDEDWLECLPPTCEPEKTPIMKYDFVEICGGAGVVSQAALQLGLTVAPPLDISESAHYDLRNERLLEWVVFMLTEDRFSSFLVEPPCSSFSAACHPALRSYENPLGFDRLEKKTLHGNVLAFRCFMLLRVGLRLGKPCGIEQPRLSKMCWTTFWRNLLSAGFQDHIISACQFGSIHRKDFRFMLFLVDDLTCKCPGGHPHVRIEGKWTRGSAVYPFDLGLHPARGFAKALKRLRRQRAAEPDPLGQESALVNDLLSTNSWELCRVWQWKRKSHINVLESFSSVSALEFCGLSHPDSRPNFLVDSQVSRGALNKGRSSSRALQPTLKRSCAVQLAFGLHPSWSFAPTRLNVADDPTRDAEIRKPCGLSLQCQFDKDSLADLHGIGLRRFAANWIRLVILLDMVRGAESYNPSLAFSSGIFIFDFLCCLGLCLDYPFPWLLPCPRCHFSPLFSLW